MPHILDAINSSGFETKLRRRLKMMAVISRTDFIQGQFAFKTKRTHQAIEKVNVFGF